MNRTGGAARGQRWLNRVWGGESLESRRVLDCQFAASVGICVPGDSDGDQQFDSGDLVEVFQLGKYDTGEAADWREGDWNGDRVFDSSDLVAVFQAGTYLQGELINDLSPVVADVPAYGGPIGPPLVISNREQLIIAIADPAAVQAILEAADFDRQKLLYFSWSGSGGDRLAVEPSMVDGHVHLELQMRFGVTNDYRPHQGLLLVPNDTDWAFEVVSWGITPVEDIAEYRFDDSSRLVMSGGIAGIFVSYAVEGTFRFTRQADGTAAIDEVDAVLRGAGSLDGAALETALPLSELAGWQAFPSLAVFNGITSDSRVVRVRVSADPDSLSLLGSDFPPCCDFFSYDINASASRVDGNG